MNKIKVLALVLALSLVGCGEDEPIKPTEPEQQVYNQQLMAEANQQYIPQPQLYNGNPQGVAPQYGTPPAYGVAPQYGTPPVIINQPPAAPAYAPTYEPQNHFDVGDALIGAGAGYLMGRAGNSNNNNNNGYGSNHTRIINNKTTIIREVPKPSPTRPALSGGYYSKAPASRPLINRGGYSNNRGRTIPRGRNYSRRGR